jgi:DNA mismatch repair protein MutS2
MPLLDPIPSPIEHADLVALEWEPLLALVAGFAASPVGRQAIVALRPSTNETWIKHQHQLAGEVRLMLSEQLSIPLGGLFDPTELAAKARIPRRLLKQKNCRRLRGWLMILRPGRLCCNRRPRAL